MGWEFRAEKKMSHAPTLHIKQQTGMIARHGHNLSAHALFLIIAFCLRAD